MFYCESGCPKILAPDNLAVPVGPIPVGTVFFAAAHAVTTVVAAGPILVEDLAVRPVVLDYLSVVGEIGVVVGDRLLGQLLFVLDERFNALVI